MATTILEWIKANAREGANISEAEGLVKDLDPLKNITTPEQALDFIRRNSVFNSAFDSEISRIVEKHDNEVLPKKVQQERAKLEEEIRKELNPEETPEQKRIRELEERINAQTKKEQEGERKAELRKKAQELGFDLAKAERYSVYGDKAIQYLEQDVKDIQAEVTTQIDRQIKDRYGNNQPPKGGKQTDPEKQMSRDDFFKMPAKQQTEFVEGGGEIIDAS